MANITKTFTYALPDEYVAQTSDLNLTAEWTYEGPAFMWVFVDNATETLQVNQSFMAVKSAGHDQERANTRAGRDQKAVLLSPGVSDTDATIASLFIGKDTGKAAGYTQKEYKFPADHANAGVVYFERPDPVSPDQTYDTSSVKYDFATNAWVTPLAFMKPWVTIEEHTSARDAQLQGAIAQLADYKSNMTADQITAAEAFIAEMQNLYTKYAGIEPFMIGFPDNPLAELVEDYDYNTDPDSLLDDAATDGE
jgi:hypothetical protein